MVLHNLGAGSLSANSTDAVNGGQINTLSGSVANVFGGGATFNPTTGKITSPTYVVQGNAYHDVGSAFSAVDQSLAGLNASVNNLQGFASQVTAQVQKNREIASTGISQALAASQLRYDDRPGRVSAGVAVGTYDGQVGLAAGIGGTSEDGHWRGNMALSYGANGRTGAAAGVTYSW